MKLLVSIAALTSLASAVAVDGLNKRDSPLDVTLEKVGNTAIKAVITNTGDSDLRVFKTGSLLDESPIEKAQVLRGSAAVPFDGVRLLVATTGLSEDAFQVIPAGGSVETVFDLAEVHDLSEGGAVDIVSEGALSYANADSTEIAGAASFSTNVLSAVEVDGEAASNVHRRSLAKRTAVQSSCTGSQRTATVNAINRCRSLASTAASQAQSNNAKMVEYFKSSSTSTKNTVVAVFNRIVSECGSTTGGVSRYYCNDVAGVCGGNVLAYTAPSQSYMVNCPLFFTALPATSTTCHAQDQQSAVLHEMTHLSQIAGTDDFGGYGYSFVRSLSASQNLRHADTYALFAQSFFAGC